MREHRRYNVPTVPELLARPKQKVHEGVSRSGKRGLFQGNTMVYPLFDGEDARTTAERADFEFVEAS